MSAEWCALCRSRVWAPKTPPLSERFSKGVAEGCSWHRKLFGSGHSRPTAKQKRSKQIETCFRTLGSRGSESEDFGKARFTQRLDIDMKQCGQGRCRLFCRWEY